MPLAGMAVVTMPHALYNSPECLTNAPGGQTTNFDHTIAGGAYDRDSMRTHLPKCKDAMCITSQ